MTNRFRQALSRLIVASGGAVIIWLVVRGWHELSGALKETSWGPFLISIFLGIAGTAVIGGVFQRFLQKYGFTVGAIYAQKLLFYGQIAKYVPGKVWSILYQANSLDGISSRALKGITAANVDLMLLSLMSSGVLGAALLFYPDSPVFSLLVVVAGFSLTVYVGTRCFVCDAIRWFVSRTRVRWNKFEIGCTDAKVNLGLLLYCIASYALPLAAYFLMLDAVFHLPGAERNTITAYFLLAWIVGTLTLIVPAGLGVKEVIFVGLGTIWPVEVSTEKLIAIAIVSRFWQVLQDIGGGAVAFLVLRSWTR